MTLLTTALAMKHLILINLRVVSTDLTLHKPMAFLPCTWNTAGIELKATIAKVRRREDVYVRVFDWTGVALMRRESEMMDKRPNRERARTVRGKVTENNSNRTIKTRCACVACV